MSGETFDKMIFDPGFQLDGAHLVEASAGTGKTYNIQNVYARLVMEKGLRVSEIQVMTFTEAATKELHDRLHLVLKDLQGRFYDPPRDCLNGKGEADLLRNGRADALIACLPPDRKTAARNYVELALLEFDNAAISTIHGFCQRVLRRYAFDTGAGLAQELENNKCAELDELAEIWWRKRDAILPAGIKLVTLKKYVRQLAIRAGYVVDHVDASSPEGFLLLAAQTIVKQYDDGLRERKKLNFDDLLRLLQRALRPDQPHSRELIAKLRQEFKAALIDEFQDTDPVQYEIFERIFLNGNGAPLFLVGDPKQAIYSFRGGDVYTYLKAKSQPGLQIGALSVNHRSTSKLVAAVDAMFRDQDGYRVFGDELIGYRDSIRVEREPDTHGRAVLDQPLQILEVELPDGLTSADRQAAVLDVLVDRIMRLLNGSGGEGPYAPAEIAVLTNSHDRSREIRQLLHRRGIPGVIRKSGNVFASPVAAELRLFLLALTDPGNTPVLLASLSTAFAGLRMEQLPVPADQQTFALWRQQYSDWCETWQTRGLAALISLLESSGYRERLAQRMEGERLLADAEQIWELALAAIGQIGPATGALIAWLTERINAAGDSAAYGRDPEINESDTEAYARELESDEQAVKIMTIHSAKGLQFPVVLLPDCWMIDPRVSLPVAYHDQDNRLHFSLSAEARLTAVREEELEKVRLLYVAMTRAAEQTVILMPSPRSGKCSAILSSLISTMRQRLPESGPYKTESVGIADAGGRKWLVTDAAPEVRRPALPLPDIGHWQRLFKGSYSSLSPSGYDEDLYDDGRDVDLWSGRAAAREDVLPIFQVPEGAATGTCWHNILERLPFAAGDEEIRRLADRMLGESGIAGQYLDDTVQMIRRTLDFPLSPPAGARFTLAEVPQELRLSEQEFDFGTAKAVGDTGSLQKIIAGHWCSDPAKAAFLAAMIGWKKALPVGFMTGFIDLIFQHDDYFYVVDWKSNSLDRKPDSFDAAGVTGEMARHGYFFQYLLYAVVLHRYLKQTLKERYAWEKNFGGIRYYFLRGIASGGPAPVFADRPSEALLDDLALALGLEA